MALRGLNWGRWLRLVRDDAAAVDPRRLIEHESYSRVVLDGGGEQVACPNCGALVRMAGYACTECGFPFVCDIEVQPERRPRIGWTTLRQVLGVLAALFWFISATVLTQGNSKFNGYTTDAVGQVSAATHSGIGITGPDEFVGRTELALGLIEQRAPDYYFRLRESVVEIRYLSKSYLEGPEGRTISLEGIGAVATPEERLVQVVAVTAFPSGLDNLYDRDLFSCAGVLVHELRHIELHYMGTAPGGWQEEVLCEEAAYDMLKHAGAPGGVLLHYELYLGNPRAGRYQHWYDWYKQWQ
jgi:hypothetical protein